ncbi:F0F1 ATP synthase subunit epsilon [Nitrospira sp. NS4]|uniref:F0F1 ATP synthase subunit epsilon n=1 Tax=Nitrospira sp. NS4 TaxID=3414498 RepID=UPI003C2FA61C
MRSFVLHLQSATQYERLDNVTAFVGQDASGSFGIMAGHERTMTPLLFGLARFRMANDEWEFLALPGAIVYFTNNELFLSTRRYLRDRDCTRITLALDEQLRAEEVSLHQVKESLRRLEEEMFKRLWSLGRGREPNL